NGLYVRPITFAVLFSLVVSIPLIVMMFAFLVKVIFMTYAGNFPLIIPTSRYLVLVGVGMLAYAAVALLHVRRIKRVPLSLAMKVQE
nr:ABC transporter permease [bacterium]